MNVEAQVLLEEPAWLGEKRKLALAAYEALPYPPLPTKDKNFPIFYPEDFKEINRSHSNIHFTCEEDKVNILPLEKAIHSHADHVKQHLGKIVIPEKNKWGALNQALWQNGVYVHVPKNLNVTSPVLIEHQLPSHASLLFPRLLVIAEANSRVVIIDHYHSTSQQKTFVAPVIEIMVQENAEVHYIQIQEWGEETHHLSTTKGVTSKNGRVTLTSCMFGGKRTVEQLQVSLRGDGSEAKLFGLVLGTHEQVFEHYTLQEHLGQQTESDLLLKVALKDKAYSNFDGLIWIEKGASKTSAYQQNRNLLLSKETKADSIPRLEILDDDVRCTHGVAVGPVDDEQLFYLESRGIPRQESEALIVEGFFQQVLERIPSENLREKLSAQLSQQIRSL